MHCYGPLILTNCFEIYTSGTMVKTSRVYVTYIIQLLAISDGDVSFFFYWLDTACKEDMDGKQWPWP